MKILSAFLLIIVSIYIVASSSVFADGVSEGRINESIYIYVPEAMTSTLLMKGTAVQIQTIVGNTAMINVILKNGYVFQAPIPTKYLDILSPPKPQGLTGAGVLGPNPVTVSPIKPLVLPQAIPSVVAATDDFYNLQTVTFHQAAVDSGEVQPTKEVVQLDAENRPLLDKNKKPLLKEVPVPYIAATVSVKEQVKTSDTVLKAYFFDQTLKLIATDSTPFVTKDEKLPVFIQKEKNHRFLFVVPDNVLADDKWSAVLIFGDSKGVSAQSFPIIGEEDYYDFPEKHILGSKSGPPIERKIAMDPLIEHVVQTENPLQPQITLFLRPPLGMTDASQAKGVLCMSLLAGSLDGVKRQLQGLEGGDDLRGILKYAEDRKLIIICWGSRRLWDPHKNWDDLSADNAWNTDKGFDQVANAWANGVQFFVKEYGIPSNDYLLWGMCGSGQYSCRLALRKPEYFLAVHAHMPGSFDKPTREARKILWCLTTGELEAGYKRSLRFYTQCQALGYPMVYKAIMHLGHADSPIADDLGVKFFDYALSVRDQRMAYDASLSNPLTQFQLAQNCGGDVQPWMESFRKPAFVGDAVNQGMVPYDQEESVPKGFRVPLPTKEIADAWNK